MTPALLLAFGLGWFACVTFIAVCEWICEQPDTDPMAEAYGDCPARPQDIEAPASREGA